MKQLLSNLIGFSVSSLDGTVGIVRDFYFDDHHWVLRYLVCELPRSQDRPPRTVLIPSGFLLPREWDLPVFPVNLTSSQIDECPGTEADLPVSKQKAQEMATTLLWPENGGIGTAGLLITPIPHKMGKPGDPCLRSFQVVRHYRLESSRGILGSVRDFAIDDKDWSIYSLIMRLRPWYRGKIVMVSPYWAQEIDWANAAIWTETHPTDWAVAPSFSVRQRPMALFSQ